MTRQEFDRSLKALVDAHERFLAAPNAVAKGSNGVYYRYARPVVTAQHAPISWRYDMCYDTNPFLLERIGVNAAFNAGAIEHEGKVLLFVRVEGADRKSFFAVAESPNGIDNFRFWDYPIVMPETDDPDTNVYDLRVTKHEDGWFYGLFCSERKDPRRGAISLPLLRREASPGRRTSKPGSGCPT